ncbi:MAG: hypothetical protein OXU67_00225 [Chloroflexota bacterium]|nr:hypothetical protein [Chloroflexota bacterium]
MPDIPNWLAWVALIISVAGNVWQWRQGSTQRAKVRHLIPTWSGWADAIRRQASDTPLIREEDAHARSVALSLLVDTIHAAASKLADDIDRVADEYRSPRELAEKEEHKQRLKEIGEEEKRRRVEGAGS